ncbi:hypothetical protein CYMTET_27840 [Cymbomonas tetramitiformis]|uniref:Uncharacterized protein n=1 Tax=Cymbomonas tetramitiformis TaxID=36881 RepID=A0AAE0KWH4_9CHLO|nr:hypothetical protein CYMTET_27840 [Cymbomonas tetramitiformis]
MIMLQVWMFKMFGSCMSMLCFLLTFVHPGVSTTIMHLFNCRTYWYTDASSVQRWLRDDSSIECGTSAWDQAIFFAGITIVIYVLGYPLAVLCKLMHARRYIMCQLPRAQTLRCDEWIRKRGWSQVNWDMDHADSAASKWSNLAVYSKTPGDSTAALEGEDTVDMFIFLKDIWETGAMSCKILPPYNATPAAGHNEDGGNRTGGGKATILSKGNARVLWSAKNITSDTQFKTVNDANGRIMKLQPVMLSIGADEAELCHGMVYLKDDIGDGGVVTSMPMTFMDSPTIQQVCDRRKN